MTENDLKKVDPARGVCAGLFFNEAAAYGTNVVSERKPLAELPRGVSEKYPERSEEIFPIFYEAGSSRWSRVFMEQFTYRFRMVKDGAMIYISHLDVLRLLSRSARRAELPVILTQGFTPRFKIKLNRALKLGVASDDEAGEISLSQRWDPAEVALRWNQALPDGLMIRDVKF